MVGPRIRSIPTADDVRRMLAACAEDTPSDIRARAMLTLQSGWALRSGELIALTVADVDHGYLTLRNRVAPVSLPLFVPMQDAIHAYLTRARPALLSSSRPTSILFLRGDGRPLTPMDWRVIVTRLAGAARAGNLTPADIRRGGIAAMLRAGATPFEVAEACGIQNPRHLLDMEAA